MTTMIIENKMANHNWGNNCEMSLRFALYGELGTVDRVRFDKGSDIDDISVKSDGFSLAYGGTLAGETFEEMLADYFMRVHSKKFAYVSREMKVYIMNKEEFEIFLTNNARLSHESHRNGYGIKIQARHESKKMIAFLENMMVA